MKHKFSFALAVVTSLLVAKVEASSYWPWESDTYRGKPLPTACRSGDLLFTVPALQGMKRSKLSIDEVTRIVNPYLGKSESDIIHDGNTVILLCRDRGEVEVSSVWKE